MDPVYGDMHLYPDQNQRDQIYYGPHFYSGTVPLPNQMYMNATRPPSHCYASPTACHGCCGHPYTNHNSWMSPYPHHVPLPHYPASYYPPFPVPHPPCYPMADQPIEKNMPVSGWHCCGCPNHKSDLKQERSVRIEEEELPGGVERWRSNSVVPVQCKNGSHPIAWIPSDGDNNNNQDVLKDGEGPFPFPFFWMPSKHEEKEKKTEKQNLEANPRFELEKGSCGDNKLCMIGEESGGRPASRVKDIQVMDAGKCEENECFKNKEKESVKDNIDHDEKKVANNIGHDEKKVGNGKIKSSKASKMPPVCLRVDPLPRKKGVKGSLQSPSHLGERDKLKEKNQVLGLLDGKKEEKISANGSLEGKGAKFIKVVDGNIKNVDANTGSLLNVTGKKHKEETKYPVLAEECQSEESASSMGRNEELCRDKEGRADEANDGRLDKVSEEAAAVIIQSAYRGFDTRRWEPLKKLKEIAKVREQMANVHHMIREMESSSDMHSCGRHRNVISETIMSLLLKMDTVQGLHPSIREVRKSVVKDLVNLQEKLDAITNEKTKDSREHDLVIRNPDNALDKIENVKLSENDDRTVSGLLDAAQNGNLEISEANSESEKSNEELEENNVSAVKDLHKELEEYRASITENLEISEANNQGVKSSEGLPNIISTVKDDHDEDLKKCPSETITEQDMMGVLCTSGNETVNSGAAAFENEGEKITALGKGEDELTESNMNLIEENERLRGVLENLIKSSQEQLRAISRLSGRVEDLERKLRKSKKKLKVKTRKNNKMRNFVVLDEE
ncbi:Large proline-rich protein bag6 [Orobanche hederae]